MFKAIENFKNNLTKPAKRKFESLIKDNPWGKKNIDETNTEDSSSSIFEKYFLSVFFCCQAHYSHPQQDANQKMMTVKKK